jgi:hypothetical protein
LISLVSAVFRSHEKQALTTYNVKSKFTWHNVGSSRYRHIAKQFKFALVSVTRNFYRDIMTEHSVLSDDVTIFKKGLTGYRIKCYLTGSEMTHINDSTLSPMSIFFSKHDNVHKAQANFSFNNVTLIVLKKIYISKSRRIVKIT